MALAFSVQPVDEREELVQEVPVTQRGGVCGAKEEDSWMHSPIAEYDGLLDERRRRTDCIFQRRRVEFLARGERQLRVCPRMVSPCARDCGMRREEVGGRVRIVLTISLCLL